MFIIEKILSNIILSPALLILLIICIMIRSAFKKETKKGMNIKLFILIVFIYLASIKPIAYLVVKPLENMEKPITMLELENADAYIMLGGGMNDSAPLALSKSGTPSSTAMVRLIETVRLYRKYPKPIIISGGKLFGRTQSEAEVAKKIMIELGVPEKDIAIEDKSRNTRENAIYTEKILKDNSLKLPIIITSATHMYRSKESFAKLGVKCYTNPTGYLYEEKLYKPIDFVPNVDASRMLITGVWEYIGIVYYKYIKD